MAKTHASAVPDVNAQDAHKPGMELRPEDFAAREAIKDLVRWERFCRDQLLFDDLAACYVPDSRVNVSWFSGTGAEFAAASRQTAERGFVSFHQINPMKIDINGARAVSESYGAIICPEMRIGGKLVTITTYARFLSRVRRTPQGWKLVTFDCVYQGDLLSPIVQGDIVPLEIDTGKNARWSYRFLIALGKANGYAMNQELPGIDRLDLVKALYADAQNWLAAGL